MAVNKIISTSNKRQQLLFRTTICVSSCGILLSFILNLNTAVVVLGQQPQQQRETTRTTTNRQQDNRLSNENRPLLPTDDDRLLSNIPSNIRQTLPDLTFPPFRQEESDVVVDSEWTENDGRQSNSTSTSSNNNKNRNNNLRIRTTNPGMLWTYNAVRDFIHFLHSKPFPHEDLIPDEVLEEPKKLPKSIEDNYTLWFKYEEVYVYVGGGLLLLAGLLFPIGYMFYCCCVSCCCCGRGGRKGKSGHPRAEQRWDGCKRNCLTVLLTVIVLAMVFIVCAGFIANHDAHRSSNQLPDVARHILDDLNRYKDKNNRMIQKLLKDDYGRLNRTILTAVQRASTAVVEGVKERSGAIAIDSLIAIAQRAKEILDQLSAIEAGVADIERKQAELKTTMSRLWVSVEGSISECTQGVSDPTELCLKTQEIFRSLQNLPSSLTQGDGLESVKHKLSLLPQYNISGQLSSAIGRFQNLESRFNDEIRGRRTELSRQLAQYAERFGGFADAAKDEIRQVQLTDAYIFIEEHQMLWRTKIENSRWIAGMVICGCLGLAIICFALGLFYGTCGKRGSYYRDEDCCVRSTGSKLFTCGITLGIFWLLIFMVIAVVAFVVGANSEWLVCHPLKHVDEREDMTSEYRQLEQALSTLTDSVQVQQWQGNLIGREAQDRLQQLESLNIERIPQNLIQTIQNQISQFDILNGINGLRKGLVGVRDPDLRKQLGSILTEVEGVREREAEPLRQSLLRLVSNLTALDSQIPNLKEEVPKWLNQVRNAEGLLATNLGPIVRNVSSEVAARLTLYIHQYRKHIQHANALWICVLLMLILLVPTIMIATSLRRLYRIKEPYHGSPYSSEYIDVPTDSSVGNSSAAVWDHRYNAYSTDSYPMRHTHTSSSNNNRHHKIPDYSRGRRSYFDELSGPPPPYHSSSSNGGGNRRRR